MTTKRLLIIGAGGFGREVLYLAKEIVNSGNCQWELGGFLDNNLDALNGYETGYKIICKTDQYQPQKEDVFICAIGDGATRLQQAKSIQQRSGTFINLIHPTAKIWGNTKVGIGLIMARYTSIGCDSSIGDFVTINTHSGCGHDNIIGDGCTLSSFVDITGWCNTGKCVFFGSHVTVTPKRKIGSYANISSGSIVFKNIKEGTTVYGNPAKILK